MRVPDIEVRDMDTAALAPYANNAKLHDSEQVGQIAASIREFGFNDPVAVWQNEDGRTEIVEGHGRVLAAQRLGMGKVPVFYLNHLSDEQRRAYTHVHNQTTLSSGWDTGVLEAEIEALDFDWGSFGFDLPSPAALDELETDGGGFRCDERLRTDDYYNLRQVNASHCEGRYDMPVIGPCDFEPSALLPFNYAKTAEDRAQTLHFFKDDYQFERLWNDPERYLDLILSFEAVLTPDFSLYMDMPLPMQQWNEYRRRALGNYWQRHGASVIPTPSWTDERSYGFCFDGLPRGYTVAVSTVGVRRCGETRRVWEAGMTEAVLQLRPARVLLYGGNIGFDFGDAEVIEYKDDIKSTKGVRSGR